MKVQYVCSVIEKFTCWFNLWDMLPRPVNVEVCTNVSLKMICSVCGGSLYCSLVLVNHNHPMPPIPPTQVDIYGSRVVVAVQPHVM